MDDAESDRRLGALLRGGPRPSPPACPPESVWAELATGQLVEEAAERARDHLIDCPACREVALDAHRFAVAMGSAGDQAAVARRRRSWLPLALLAAALAIAVGATAWWLSSRRVLPVPTWTAAAYAPSTLAPDAPLMRDAAALDPRREAAFAVAMAPYLAGDWDAAERALGAWLAAEPDDLRATFYRAVVLGLGGQRPAALPLLEQVAREASPRLADEARWYLALAALDAGKVEHARGLLEAVAASGSRRATEAAALADRLAQ